jgi:hypothetical protein
MSFPAACRGHGVTFTNDAVYFVAANDMAAGLALKSNAWSAAMGTVRTCVNVVGAGCSSSNVAITSVTVPPLATSIVNIANGNDYGARLRTTLAAPGGTATIVLYLYQFWIDAANGDRAVLQVDTVTLSITQL